MPLHPLMLLAGGNRLSIIDPDILKKEDKELENFNKKMIESYRSMVTESKRPYPVNVFESENIESLFEFYKRRDEPITLRLESEDRILIIKYFQLLKFVGGISSIIENGGHVGFIDIDGINLRTLTKKLIKIQKEFDLSSWYILESSKDNFHCICLDKHSFGFWIDVLKLFDNEKTLQYQRFAINRGRFILRVTKKENKAMPKLVAVISRSNSSIKSNAHWMFLKLRYGIPKPQFLDFHTKLKFKNYTTVKK